MRRRFPLVMKLTIGIERGPRVLESMIPVVDEDAPISRGTGFLPEEKIR